MSFITANILPAPLGDQRAMQTFYQTDSVHPLGQIVDIQDPDISLAQFPFLFLSLCGSMH